jgi:hypothetical protein
MQIFICITLNFRVHVVKKNKTNATFKLHLSIIMHSDFVSDSMWAIARAEKISGYATEENVLAAVQ